MCKYCDKDNVYEENMPKYCPECGRKLSNESHTDD